MKHYISYLFLLFTLSVFSQESENKDRGSVAVAMVPQYAIMGGMRIDGDFQIKEKQYLTLGPQLYYSNNSILYPPSETDFKGFGLKATYRYFPGEKAKPQGGYIAFGLDYKYLNTTYNSYDYYSYYEDDLSYLTVGDELKNSKFNQAGFDMLVGYQFIIGRDFLLDLYLGWGFRISDFDPNKEGNNDEWASDILDPGYSGFVPVVGVRVGILLN